jgi:transposase
MTPSKPVYVGIDTSKAQLEVAIGQTIAPPVDNTRAGIGTLIARLPKDVALVVIESTGCYSQLAANLLAAAGYRVAVVQPGRIKHYARSQGLLAKTDRIDARIIAQFGEHSPGLVIYQEPSEARKRLRALVDRRDQVVEDRVREENRLEACLDTTIQKHLKASIARLRKADVQLARHIDALIKADGEMSAIFTILESMKGVGSLTAANLLAHLPELGCVNRQEIAALAGVAPYNNDSGPRQGQRSIYGGRQRVRSAMHMAAVSASRHDENMASFYRRLLDRGKPTKVALVAVVRKMLIKLNGLVADYRKTIAQPAAVTS